MEDNNVFILCQDYQISLIKTICPENVESYGESDDDHDDIHVGVHVDLDDHDEVEYVDNGANDGDTRSNSSSDDDVEQDKPANVFLGRNNVQWQKIGDDAVIPGKAPRATILHMKNGCTWCFSGNTPPGLTVYARILIIASESNQLWIAVKIFQLGHDGDHPVCNGSFQEGSVWTDIGQIVPGTIHECS